MKCSLLTLSTFVDGELAPQRTAEVDAHLVGCTRCSAGAATLREEKARIGQLARVTVDPASAQLMLEQVGIAIDSVVQAPADVPPPPAAPPDEHRPWQAGTSSPSLPWTPQRPEPPATAADTQPELPLDGVRAAPASWNRPAEPAAPAPPAPKAEPIEVDEEWLNGAAESESWEADLPPPTPELGPAPADTWIQAAPPPVAPGSTAEPVAPYAEPAPTDPLEAPTAAPHAGPPTRLAAASGPAALWTRIHDAVTVRLALSRGGDSLEDSAQIVSGAPARPAVRLPGVVDAPPEVELSGLSEVQRAAAPSIDSPPAGGPGTAPRQARGALGGAPPSAEDTAIPDGPVAAQPADWNAFAASSYPGVDAPVEEERVSRARPLGRHGRAVAREQVPLSTRLSAAVAGATTAVRRGATKVMGGARQGAGRMSRGGPDNRLLAGIAGIGLIFVVALLITRSPAHPGTPAATRTVPTTAPQSHPSTPAQPSAAAATSAAPALVQTFGAGDTGFQVIRLRYGAQKTYMRVVFDLGAAGATAAAGTPKVTVSFPTPTTMLVTLDGTLPAGSTGTPTPGKVISSVTLVSSTGHKAVYRFGLTRPATATALYLASPTRFVLDVH